MKKLFFILFALCSVCSFGQNQWNGKRVGFLGDSMTDPGNKASSTHYWACLAKDLGIESCVYARSGYTWSTLMEKAELMNATEGQRLDAIIIWCGTNDFFHDAPLGEFFVLKDSSANVNGKIVPLKHREFIFNKNTFCGRINSVMSFLKQKYPNQLIVIMTPIHRAYANFSSASRANVQPDEMFSNSLGLFLDDYVHVLKRAGEIWSVPVVDLYSNSGLFPLYDEYTKYFANPNTDRLHPNDLGHRRIADILKSEVFNKYLNY